MAFLAFGIIDTREDLDKLFLNNGLVDGRATFEQFERVVASIHESRRAFMTSNLVLVMKATRKESSFHQQYDIHCRNRLMAGIMAKDQLSKAEQKAVNRLVACMKLRITTAESQ